jgi:hypothetical protein
MTATGRKIIFVTKSLQDAMTTRSPPLTPDQRHFACCDSHQRLRGGGEGEEVVGLGRGLRSCVGYQCCPVGQSFNGWSCERVYKNGRLLEDGECACPPATVESFNGTCDTRARPDC